MSSVGSGRLTLEGVVSQRVVGTLRELLEAPSYASLAALSPYFREIIASVPYSVDFSAKAYVYGVRTLVKMSPMCVWEVTGVTVATRGELELLFSLLKRNTSITTIRVRCDDGESACALPCSLSLPTHSEIPPHSHMAGWNQS